jgi:hypothetical protein
MSEILLKKSVLRRRVTPLGVAASPSSRRAAYSSKLDEGVMDSTLRYIKSSAPATTRFT